MGRLGLVLAGGSCRCAFQVGVLQALTARGLRFDAVGAVSSGVWNATAVATGRIEVLEELWLGASRFPVYSLRHLRFNTPKGFSILDALVRMERNFAACASTLNC